MANIGSATATEGDRAMTVVPETTPQQQLSLAILELADLRQLLAGLLGTEGPNGTDH